MKIDFYNNLADKGNNFDRYTIDTQAQLDDIVKHWTTSDNTKNFIFRGVTEAKYKLYNSAQRSWKTYELANLGKTFQDFIQTEVDKAKAFQNNLLTKFYNAFGHTAYDLSILSFLQHYGAPTPLLDWTYNFDNALFFGIDGLKHNPSSDIDNYFSIYAIDLRWHEFISITTHLENSLDQIDRILREYPAADAKEVLGRIENLNYSYFHDLKLFYLPGYTSGGIFFGINSRPTFKLVYNQHNLNIINQEGLFVFNSDPDHPLEDYFKGKNNSSFDGTFYIPKIICFDIHKSLDEYVKRHLTEGRAIPIDKDFIYPQEENIAKTSFIEYKNLK
ncbi:MAG: FRG domain-containing protein [Flavobacteriales bacterium]|nr:FRG domain-containing protein [Flavobacteriales bacterium]